MATSRDENVTDMSENGEWILLEEKIYLLRGVLPRDENEYDMPVIGVNSNETKRQSSIDHTSSFFEKTHKKNSRTAKVICTSKTKAKAPPELISVDEVSMLTNPHRKKLVVFQIFNSLATAVYVSWRSFPKKIAVGSRTWTNYTWL